MSGWMENLIGYMLIVSVVMHMIPNKKYEQYVKLFTGLLLILIALQPVLKVGGFNELLENKILEFVREQELAEENIGKESREFQKQTERIDEKTNMVNIETILPVEVVLNE